MFSPDKPLPPPPAASKSRNESLAASMPSYRNRPSAHAGDSSQSQSGSGFSFASTKSLFESLNRPQVREGIAKVAHNPTVQRAAVSAAKNEEVRSGVANIARNPQNQQAAIGAAQTPAGRNAILSMAKQFENKPVMGFGAPSQPPPPANHAHPSGTPMTIPSAAPTAPSRREALYPSLTGDSYMNKTSPLDSFGHSAYRPKSTEPNNYNALLEDIFADKSGQKVPPARPPPPKLGSRSNPNISGLYNSQNLREPHAVVKFPYQSEQHDELKCNVDDVVLLKQEVDDKWIYATNTRTGQSGIVPINFLTIKVPLVPTASSLPFTSSSTTSNMSFSNSTYTGFNNAHEHIAKALYDYDTGVEGDLKFFAGDIINVIERVDEEWLRGECNLHRGIFPINYVFIQHLEFVPRANGGKSLADSLSKLSFKPHFVTATYGYYSGEPDDLVFEAGDVIQVVEEVNGEWIRGSLHGRTGLVPLTYVERNN